MATKQLKYRFDRLTLIKIGKGALIAASGAAALFLLDFAGSLDLQDPVAASFVAWAVPTLTNVVKEFLKGK